MSSTGTEAVLSGAEAAPPPSGICSVRKRLATCLWSLNLDGTKEALHGCKRWLKALPVQGRDSCRGSSLYSGVETGEKKTWLNWFSVSLQKSWKTI